MQNDYIFRYSFLILVLLKATFNVKYPKEFRFRTFWTVLSIGYDKEVFPLEPLEQFRPNFWQNCASGNRFLV